MEVVRIEISPSEIGTSDPKVVIEERAKKIALEKGMAIRSIFPLYHTQRKLFLADVELDTIGSGSQYFDISYSAMPETKPKHGAAIPEPPPTPNRPDLPNIYQLVMQDIADRAKMGFEKYHVYLQPYNGRSSLWDAYQEVIDLAKYIRTKIWEEENPDWRPNNEGQQQEKST